jgi:hypothetical protein
MDKKQRELLDDVLCPFLMAYLPHCLSGVTRYQKRICDLDWAQIPHYQKLRGARSSHNPCYQKVAWSVIHRWALLKKFALFFVHLLQKPVHVLCPV